MKKIAIFILFISISASGIFSQTVPVTLHYKPVIEDFTTLRLVGNFNGWNNNDPDMVMTDNDGDGVYEITKEFATGVEHMYKFVFDADWSFAWNDPDNPAIKVTDNDNSILNVTDPYITYLLPRGVNSKGSMYIDTTVAGEPIRAIFAYSESNPIDLNSLSMTIDGTPVDNPQQYYIDEKKEFYYEPPVPLAEGEHTVEVSITSPAGTAVKSSTFRRTPGLLIYKAPVDFYFDEYNTGSSIIQNIYSVSLVGNFNNWNESFDPMEDDDQDGLWEGTTFLEQGSYEYKFKLNGSLWINDPDEPEFSDVSDNNIFTVVVDSIPSMKLKSPGESTVFNGGNNSFTLNVLLRPGVKSNGVDESTITVKLNENPVPHQFNIESLTVSSDISLVEEGNNYVEVSYANLEGLIVSQVFAYGLYLNSTGIYNADAINDEIYTYPSGVPEGSADIVSVQIDEVLTHDSLTISTEITDITDRTRLGLLITNPTATASEMPFALDLMTESWNTEGIFIPIGAPGSAYFNSEIENRVWTSPDSAGTASVDIEVNNDALESDRFEFNISLAYLDSLLGSWTRERNFYLFTYLANEDLSGDAFEVTESEGGSDEIEDPDIYDAAFFRSGFWQRRVLSNYIPIGGRMGPRLVSFNGLQRGKTALNAGDISDSLQTYGPAITFATPAVSYWYPEVIVKGSLSDPEITSITFSFNGVETEEIVLNSEFSVPVTLEEGENIIFVKASDSKGFEATSKNLVLIYEQNHDPEAEIFGSVEGRSVTLTAAAFSPDSLAFTYYWTDDDDLNPDNLFGAKSDETIVFSIPEKEGEYFVNLRVRDSEGRYAYARKLIFAEGDSVSIAGINDHAAWIDDAIFYEIYPRSYSSTGDFTEISNKIPDMLDLGINAVWLMPIYTGPTEHGYEITDYFGFEEDYGTEEEFRSLVDAFHNAGIKVILDFVVNHTSIQHRFMQNVFAYGTNSPWADFYIWEGEPGNSNYEYFFDWASLPNLNHNNKDVRNYFINVAEYWIKEYDIDGFRCDVAWGVEERNSEFWQDWRKAVKNLKPEAFLQAEASSGQSVYYQGRFDSANDWDLRNDLLNTAAGTLAIGVLDSELRKDYPDYARPFRFVENHDEVRVASSYGTKRSKLLHTILMTANGVPLIYSGGEVGELTNRGLIDWSDPDKIRPYFKTIISIRKQFISKPLLQRLENSLPSDIYSYASISGEHLIITAANFRESTKNVSIDLSILPNDGESTYFLSNLFDSSYVQISASELNNVAVELSGYESKVYYLGLQPTVVGNEEDEMLIIDEFRLNQNYPNPFNPSTKISFQLPQQEFVTLKIFDALGREVSVLVNEELKKGKYEIDFDASDLASGIYFYRIKAGSFLATKKLMLIK